MQIIINLLLAGLVLLSASLQRTYQTIPSKELKRRARTGDRVADGLYKAVGYGYSLRIVLWFLVLASSALFFVNIAMHSPAWVALLLCGLVAWLGFVWLPAREVSSFGLRLANFLAPAFAWILNYLHPILDKVFSFVRRHRPLTIHTGLYDRDDLLELLERQYVQPDNRIDAFNLQVAMHALTFGDQIVRDILVPRRVVKSVIKTDTIGPILMSELHESGHSRFPVFDSATNHIVGTLFLRDLVSAKAGGSVESVMRQGVFYIHEEQSLAEALQAMLKKRQHLFVVVNSFEEYVGIVTIEDILEQIIGDPIIDEFDEYEDLRAVAAVMAKKEHQQHQQTPSSETTEVVEYPDENIS